MTQPTISHSSGPNKESGNAYAWKQRKAASDLQLDGLAFPERGRIRTTFHAYADEKGRPAPKSSSQDAHARWLAHSGQFAPWHYKREAMMQDDTGCLIIPFFSKSKSNSPSSQ